MKVSTWLLAGAAILAAVPAGAATTIYSTRAAFNAAAGGGLSLESFETPVATSGSLTYAGFTVTEVGGIPGIAHSSVVSLVPAALSDGQFYINYDDNDPSVLTFVFNTAINAIGFNLAFDGAQTATFGGGVTGSLALAANTNGFFGAISDTAFTTFTIDVSGGPNVGIDALAFGTAATAGVPEPATWAMTIAGFGLLGGALRRRQRASISFA